MEIENSAPEKNIRQRQDEEDIKEIFTYKKAVCLIVKEKNSGK
ncbi:MAG: hypothetical protein QXQ14_02870 [Candidatus Aenigmatarchaeota archaeon]